ncbi:ABC transporter permease subunit [Streptomyces sp. AK02-01A]|uniref:ABC transporter permease subunit n=1 Tax=Streptomyces sp. AK02-01A TaxID=3028648 RepID=UPI0039F6DB0B
MSTATAPTGTTMSPEIPAQLAANRRRKRKARVTAVLFALPALTLLGALVGYPILYSAVRSTYDAGGSHFVGLSNYGELFQDKATLTALRNTAVWVIVVPALLTGLGLILAVLTEKIRWATAFKLLIFMPMAVSFLAAGITFRLVYDQDPQRGVLNAATVGIHDAFADSAGYPGARPRDATVLKHTTGGAYTTVHTTGPGEPLTLGLVGLPPTGIPAEAKQAVNPATTQAADAVTGVVYVDFAPGGGGKPNQVDLRERGLPGITLQLTRDGKTVAETTSSADGSFAFKDTKPGTYAVRLPAENFAEPYGGISWLGRALITPAIMGAYLWVWTGFAMVLIGAGLSALPREMLEAARMDGANEWNVFRRITVPLLAPVLSVVFVTLIINVMKVFDLVYIIAPGPVQQDANVLALQMWLVSFGGGNNQGLGSAIGVVLLLLVIPAMAVNIRRFRRSR